MTDSSPILQFTDQYQFLSNFYPAVVEYEGMIYPSVEHAYQAAKTEHPLDRQMIQKCISPARTKKLGKLLTLPVDWETKKLGVMFTCVQSKFTVTASLRDKLLDTGHRELIEGNKWKDQFWGVYEGRGENHLGRILMEVRSGIRLGKYL